MVPPRGIVPFAYTHYHATSPPSSATGSGGHAFDSPKLCSKQKTIRKVWPFVLSEMSEIGII